MILKNEYYIDRKILKEKKTEIENLGPTASEIFTLVSQNGPLTSREVAEILFKRHNNGIAGIQSKVAELSQRGLIERRKTKRPLPHELFIDDFIKFLHPFRFIDRETASIITQVTHTKVCRSTVSRKRRNLGLPANRYIRQKIEKIQKGRGFNE